MVTNLYPPLSLTVTLLCVAPALLVQHVSYHLTATIITNCHNCHVSVRNTCTVITVTSILSKCSGWSITYSILCFYTFGMPDIFPLLMIGVEILLLEWLYIYTKWRKSYEMSDKHIFFYITFHVVSCSLRLLSLGNISWCPNYHNHHD